MRNGERCGDGILGRRNSRDGCNEAVAHSCDGLDETGTVRLVAQNVSKLRDRGVDSVLGVDEHLAGPESLGDLSAGDDLTFAGGEQDEKLDWLPFHFEEFAIAQQLESGTVELVLAKLDHGSGQSGRQKGLRRAGKWLQSSTQACVSK